VVLAAALCAPPATSQEDKEASHALLVGSVFTAEGLSLPGVKVSIKRKDDKKPRWRAVSDNRGEFAVRLPIGQETYEITTDDKKFEAQTKTVQVHGAERVDVFFRLTRKEDLKEKKDE